MKNYAAMIAGIVLAGASVVWAQGSSMAALNPDVLEGKDVFDSAGEQLGDIDEVVKDKSDQHMAVIGLEGSAREVAIPVSKLSMTADGKQLKTTMTRAQLEALPDYDPMDMKSVPE
jgi:sporulation protein YlmC with PRC-barrel domain